MRKAWERALEEPRRAPSVHPEISSANEAPALTDAQIQAIPADTPIEALPLSTRAKNALDRAGISRVEQLHILAANRLSAIRGIGTKVAKEILDFRTRWRGGAEGTAPIEVFYLGYRGDDVALETEALPAAAVRALVDIGATGFVSLAAAAKEQVLALSQREGFDAAQLRKRLDEEQKRLNEREQPTTLEGFVAAFMPKSGKARPYLEALFGFSPPFTGRLDVTAGQVAKHFGISPSNIYILLATQRKRWAQHGAADELVSRIGELVRDGGGAVSVSRAAQLLAARFPADETAAELRIARAAALLRIAAELERERGKQLHYARAGNDEPWLFGTDPDSAKLAALGAAADALAEREPLASPAEAARQLALIVEGTPLETLAPARLVELACSASKHAACSSRLEIYPRGLAPERVLALSASVLKSGVTPEDVVARAKERYPLAPALPLRPELDGMMRAIGFEWHDAEQAYVRPGERGPTSLGTAYGGETRLTTAATGQPRRQTPDALAARDFEQRLRAAVEDDAFRVLGVSIDQGAWAAQQLSAALGVEPRSFDALFLAELDRITEAGKPSLDLVHETDRNGRDAPGWNNLKKLAERCAASVLAQLMPAKQPLLLHQLGLLERYGLSDFLHALVQSAQSPASKAVFLIVPCPDTGGLPRINGGLAIPGLLPGQGLWVPLEWLKNKHNAAA
jgi:hypothetical protein